MSSIKRLKSKRQAHSGTPRALSHAEATLTWYASDYDYRKAAFAGLPPATTVRPMRIVKARVQAAMEAVQRGLQAAAKAGLSFDAARQLMVPQQAELGNQLSVYKQARAHADAGYGWGVHLAAR